MDINAYIPWIPTMQNIQINVDAFVVYLKVQEEGSIRCGSSKIQSCLIVLMNHLNIKRDLRWIHHFKSDMDHMRIAGIEPSSVILGQTKKIKKL